MGWGGTPVDTPCLPDLLRLPCGSCDPLPLSTWLRRAPSPQGVCHRQARELSANTWADCPEEPTATDECGDPAQPQARPSARAPAPSEAAAPWGADPCSAHFTGTVSRGVCRPLTLWTCSPGPCFPSLHPPPPAGRFLADIKVVDPPWMTLAWFLQGTRVLGLAGEGPDPSTHRPLVTLLLATQMVPMDEA